MPDGPAPLAATYRLLTRLCPPLAVTLTHDIFTLQDYASHRTRDPAVGPPEPGPNAAGAWWTGEPLETRCAPRGQGPRCRPGTRTEPGARDACGASRTSEQAPWAREVREVRAALGVREVRAAPGAWGVPGARGAMNVLDALDVFVDGEADRVEAVHRHRPRRDVAASRFLHHYLWSVGLLFTGPWYLAGRIPAIPPAALTADPATGAFTLATDLVTCGDQDGETRNGQTRDGRTAPWDSPATEPDAIPNAPRRTPDSNPGTAPGTPHDATAALRAAVAAHVGPVLEAFAPHVRRGPRALWGMATDDLASGLWFLGRACGEEERGIRAATTLLPGGTPPFPGAADFRVLRGPSGHPHPTRTRLGCCLFYAVSAAGPCLTCPRLTAAERLRRLEPG